MADFLVELGTHPRARRVIKALGLPIPLPAKLEREAGPWRECPLQDRPVMVCAGPGAELTAVLADTLTAAGADPWLVDMAASEGESGIPEAWRKAGEAWGRTPRALAPDETPERLHPYALVLDATGITTTEQLRALYDFFHPRIRTIGRSGRLLVIGRDPQRRRNPEAAAAAAALEGFVRSAAREVGRGGATANLVTVQNGAEDRLAPVLRFLLSPRSAYVSGQPIRVESGVKAPKQVPDLRPLEGKVALVTGAARGIGAATARTLAREGARVIVLDRPDDDGPASKVASEVHGTLLLCDLSAEDAPQTIASFVKEHFEGKLDIVVHNAGITRDKMLGNMSDVLRVTEALDPLLRDGGRVVCLSSTVGISGNAGQTNYATSKAGLIGFVRALAPSLKKRGITVNAVAPGFIETRLTAVIPIATREVARRLSNVSQGGLPEDVAEVITFLASPGAHGITGEVLRVCGGSFVGA
ncbi:MAG: 3-oxoacyl-ACP reductase [Deltaproteobacteria bacterium]|nr:3-oxoacyl-ACP reductase [Deltaproteobacteria bacterium]